MAAQPDESRRALGVCTCVLVALHLLLAPHVGVFGAAPGFLLAGACVVAAARGRAAGCVAGFALGLLFDLTGSGPIGLSSLVWSVGAFALGRACEARPPEGLLAKLPACCAALLACNLAYPLFLLAFGTPLGLGWALVGRVVVGTLVDVLVAAACLWALGALPAHRTSGGVRLG